MHDRPDAKTAETHSLPVPPFAPNTITDLFRGTVRDDGTSFIAVLVSASRASNAFALFDAKGAKGKKNAEDARIV